MERIRRPLVAGNWKMNGLRRSQSELTAIVEAVEGRGGRIAGDVMVCPPATLIVPFADVVRSSAVMLGGQDCHVEPSGAFTGDISAEMLKDAGAEAVIVGHSERRNGHGETNALVRAKAEAAHRAGLTAIICLGESADDRKRGATLRVVEDQLAQSLPAAVTAGNTVIAYEPVWAIGTGLTPTPTNIAEVHEFIRNKLVEIAGDAAAETRILYGGSVKPENAADIAALTNVDGALVGGASLKAADFMPIVEAFA